MAGTEDHHLNQGESDRLMSAVGAGDPRALRRLYDLRRADAYRTALMLIGVPASAARVTADVFVELFQHPRGSTTGFDVAMYRSIVRHSEEHMMRSKGSAGSVEMKPVQASCSPERKQDIHRLVGAGLRDLDPTLRVPFVLCESQGLSNEDVARILDMSPATVTTRLAEARQRLTRALGDVGLEAWNVG